MRSSKLRSALLVPLAAFGLAACDIKVDDKPKGADVDNGSVASMKTEGNRTEISIPGIGTKISLPQVNVGGPDMDLDGMKLYPGTQIATMDVRADKPDDKGGSVRLTFTSKDSPAAIAAYYRSAAAQAGFTVDPAGGDAKVTAVKADGKQFGLQLDPQGSGAYGTIVIDDRD